MIHPLVVVDPHPVQIVITPLSPSVQIVIGRLPASSLPIADQEISGRHAVLAYSPASDRWSVTDAGSLNGSSLDGASISAPQRAPGQPHTLAAEGEHMLELGEVTKIRVACGPGAPLQNSKRRAPAGEAAGPRLPRLFRCPLSRMCNMGLERFLSHSSLFRTVRSMGPNRLSTLLPFVLHYSQLHGVRVAPRLPAAPVSSPTLRPSCPRCRPWRPSPPSACGWPCTSGWAQTTCARASR